MVLLLISTGRHPRLLRRARTIHCEPLSPCTTTTRKICVNHLCPHFAHLVLQTFYALSQQLTDCTRSCTGGFRQDGQGPALGTHCSLGSLYTCQLGTEGSYYGHREDRPHTGNCRINASSCGSRCLHPVYSHCPASRSTNGDHRSSRKTYLCSLNSLTWSNHS